MDPTMPPVDPYAMSMPGAPTQSPLAPPPSATAPFQAAPLTPALQQQAQMTSAMASPLLHATAPAAVPLEFTGGSPPPLDSHAVQTAVKVSRTFTATAEYEGFQAGTVTQRGSRTEVEFLAVRGGKEIPVSFSFDEPVDDAKIQEFMQSKATRAKIESMLREYQILSTHSGKRDIYLTSDISGTTTMHYKTSGKGREKSLELDPSHGYADLRSKLNDYNKRLSKSSKLPPEKAQQLKEKQQKFDRVVKEFLELSKTTPGSPPPLAVGRRQKPDVPRRPVGGLHRRHPPAAAPVPPGDLGEAPQPPPGWLAPPPPGSAQEQPPPGSLPAPPPGT